MIAGDQQRPEDGDRERREGSVQQGHEHVLADDHRCHERAAYPCSLVICEHRSHASTLGTEGLRRVVAIWISESGQRTVSACRV